MVDLGSNFIAIEENTDKSIQPSSGVHIMMGPSTMSLPSETASTAHARAYDHPPPSDPSRENKLFTSTKVGATNHNDIDNLLTDTVKNQETIIATLQAERRAYQEEAYDLLTKITTLEAKRQAEEGEAEGFRTNNVEKLLLLKQYSNQIIELETKLTDVIGKKDSLETQLMQVRGELEATRNQRLREKKSLVDKVTTLEAKIARVTTENIQLEQKLDSLRYRNQRAVDVLSFGADKDGKDVVVLDGDEGAISVEILASKRECSTIRCRSFIFSIQRTSLLVHPIGSSKYRK